MQEALDAPHPAHERMMRRLARIETHFAVRPMATAIEALYRAALAQS
jgi:hypothetical protein